MFYHHLRNELWKLFGKKRTYIGFGAFLLAQNAMLLTFRFTHWQTEMERMLEGNGYLAQEYVSALTVAVIMLIPQVVLLLPLYVALVGGDLVAKEVEDGTLAHDPVAPDLPVPPAVGQVGGGGHFCGGAGAGPGRHGAGICAPLVSVEGHVCLRARTGVQCSEPRAMASRCIFGPTCS